jgi:hypothetical protein
MLSHSGLAQDADTVVATVNGEAITLGQMITMRQGLAPDATQNMPDTALWDLMLDQMIRQTAVAQAAGKDLSRATRPRWRSSGAPIWRARCWKRSPPPSPARPNCAPPMIRPSAAPSR